MEYHNRHNTTTIFFENLRRQSELTNHLGNVQVVINDKRQVVDAEHDGNVDYFTPDVLAVNDYYPGGSLMPGRNFNSNSYRYSFNGMEKDDEITGIPGTFYTT